MTHYNQILAISITLTIVNYATLSDFDRGASHKKSDTIRGN